MSEKEFNEICNLDNIADSAGGFVDLMHHLKVRSIMIIVPFLRTAKRKKSNL